MTRRFLPRFVAALLLAVVLGALAPAAHAAPGGGIRDPAAPGGRFFAALGSLLEAISGWVGPGAGVPAADARVKAGPVIDPHGEPATGAGTASEPPPDGSTDAGPVADPHG